MVKTEKKYYEISAITKCCLLIEKLSTQKTWELADLSRAMGLPKTTVHRMLLTLVDNGYVYQEKERGEYSLTFKLFSMGSKVLRHSSVVDVARPYCRELLGAVDETVNLCVASGTEMLVVDKQVTSQMLRQDSIIGSSFPLFQSASGKIFLAFAEEEEAERVLNLIREQSPQRDIDRALPGLRSELEEVRRTGLAYDYEEVFKGVRCTAVPIFDFQNRLVATLSVSAPTVRLNEVTSANIERNIIRAAIGISQRLGASPAILPFNIAG
ncbi:IclR family transcriptional regulator [Desulfovibrio sp. Huiquan2017]|uniref:IclR family transcriptional regulator n=1 Tax=Desulfovibrio sp. Huiquan2017 TaxID=2816861 RepID=UPI001A938FD0